MNLTIINSPALSSVFASIKNKEYDKVLLEGVEVLDFLCIPYWLSAGTMLGIYRDGKPIDEDTDVDVGIFGGDIDYDRLEKRLNDSGFTEVRKTTWDSDTQQWAFAKHDVIFDIYFYYEDHGVLINHADWGLMRKPISLVKPFHTIDYKGKEYNCPDPINYCEWRYGKDWQIPQRNSDDWSHMRRE